MGMFTKVKEPGKVRKPFDRVRTTFKTVGESATHQSFKAECDINRIMRKWEKTGIIEHRNNFQGQYADFTNVPSDYQEALQSVINAQEMFETLPAQVRKKFANDPGLFLEFATDPKNADEMVSMGLAHRSDLEVIEEAPTARKTAPKNKKEEAPEGDD